MLLLFFFAVVIFVIVDVDDDVVFVVYVDPRNLPLKVVHNSVGGWVMGCKVILMIPPTFLRFGRVELWLSWGCDNNIAISNIATF